MDMMHKMGPWGMGMGEPMGMGMMGGMGMKHGVMRKYYTKKEKAEWLEEQIKEMEMELAGMKEKLADLKK